METNNRKSEKINEINNKVEKTKQKDITNNPKTDDLKLNKELETDVDGNKSVVDRARDSHEDTDAVSNKIDHDDPNAKRGVKTDKEAIKLLKTKT